MECRIHNTVGGGILRRSVFKINCCSLVKKIEYNTPETMGLITAVLMNKMKLNTVFIGVLRLETIDEGTLYEKTKGSMFARL